ncbi:MAG: hypothetical protein A2136_06380 [Chloroflexi bacterium RBG_16_54_11]|nr:MAG: hypothetical protein A2136_06380 [Chloroflexi bacterium RBG_16_54_11]
MAIKFLVDENLGINLALGLRNLGHSNIEHILEKFEPGVVDEEWLKYVGENKYAIITKDKNIRKNPLEKALLKKYNIIAFYLGGSQTGITAIGKQLMNAWDKWKNVPKDSRKKEKLVRL